MKFNIHLSYNTEISLLSRYPDEMKMYIYTKMCIQILIADTFVITKNWKQLKLLFSWSVNKQAVTHSYNRILLVIKGNELLICTKT